MTIEQAYKAGLEQGNVDWGIVQVQPSYLQAHWESFAKKHGIVIDQSAKKRPNA